MRVKNGTEKEKTVVVKMCTKFNVNTTAKIVVIVTLFWRAQSIMETTSQRDQN